MFQKYSLNLIRQVGEIPLQLLHHEVRAKGLQRPQKVKFGKHFRQYLLFWMPPADAPKTNSIVLFAHGGAWRVGAPYLHPCVPLFYLNLGYPVAMTAYRLAPFYHHDEMMEDMVLALKTTLKLKEKYRLPHEKILAGGMSAGATLMANLVYNHDFLKKNGFGQSLFSGFLSNGGPLDLDRMPNFRALRQYVGGRPNSAAWHRANPKKLLRPNESLPALLTHSLTDAIVPYEAAESFFVDYPNADAIELFPIVGSTHLDSLRYATDDEQTAEKIREWLGGLEVLGV